MMPHNKPRQEMLTEKIGRNHRYIKIIRFPKNTPEWLMNELTDLWER